jgi:hypothetical protein
MGPPVFGGLRERSVCVRLWSMSVFWLETGCRLLCTAIAPAANTFATPLPPPSSPKTRLRTTKAPAYAKAAADADACAGATK